MQKPPIRAVAVSTLSGSSKCPIVFFMPSATRTIPATMGRWRIEYESRAISFRSWRSAMLARRRVATSATTSKYAHHIAAASAMPTTAVATTPAVISPVTPAPIATIDSPRAMMMMRPWRSAKCSGMSFQPSAPKK